MQQDAGRYEDLLRENADLRAELARRDITAGERGLLQLLIDHAPVAIAVLDRDLVFRFASRHARLAGKPAEDLLERALLDVFPQAEGTLEPLLREVLATGQTCRLVAQYFPHLIDGRLEDTYWDVELVPVPADDGRPIGLLGIGTEVTEQVQREERDRAIFETLERNDQLKDEFLGMISHELRTPVHILTGFLGIVLKYPTGALVPRQRTFLQRAVQKTEELAAIINVMLDFSQIRAGTLTLAHAPVAASAYLRELVGPLVEMAGGKGVLMTSTIPDDLPEVICDPVRIGQVVTNLVGNAVKFTPGGGAIHLRTEVRGNWWRVEVTDTGPGIDPAERKRIFERFSQADMSMSRAVGGLGLGLAIVREFVEAHGGTVGVESEPGRGSSFWFEVPLRPPEA